VDDARKPADNPQAACEDDVHGRDPSTGRGRRLRPDPTRRAHPHRRADLRRRGLSTASTAPMTMTRSQS